MPCRSPTSRSTRTPLIGGRHLRLARAYGERFPDEMAAFAEDAARPLDELRRLYLDRWFAG